MKRIEVNVEDDKLEEFLNKIEEFMKSMDLGERDLTIFGLSVKEYKKECLPKTTSK